MINEQTVKFSETQKIFNKCSTDDGCHQYSQGAVFTITNSKTTIYMY